MLYLLTYLLLVLTWAFYVAAINLLPKLPTLKPIVRVHATAVVLVAVLLDTVLHLVLGTVLFLDPPRELLLTARLKRYKTGSAGKLRCKAATWICAHLLNPFDPNGNHC